VVAVTIKTPTALSFSVLWEHIEEMNERIEWLEAELAAAKAEQGRLRACLEDDGR
jgi:uncharacterized small protein (DUF1192 family)